MRTNGVHNPDGVPLSTDLLLFDRCDPAVKRLFWDGFVNFGISRVYEQSEADRVACILRERQQYGLRSTLTVYGPDHPEAFPF